MKSPFGKESMERISSPEDLSDYLHVTTPATWVVLTAVVLLLAGFLVWSSVTAVESYAYGSAQVRSGVLTISFDDAEQASRVREGMNVKVGGTVATVLSVGSDDSGRPIAIANVNLPDGAYEARVGYRSTQIIELLFN